MFKEYFKKLIATKEARAAEIKKLIAASQNIDEVRSLGAEKESVEAELAEARSKLSVIEADETRGAKPGENLNPVAMYGLKGTENQERSNEDPRGTLEYRTQFMEYVRTGTIGDKLQQRANAVGTAANLGILLPITIEQTIQQALKGHYGSLYNKVKKTDIVGGVKVPVGSFTATFNRITETGAPSDRQNPGGVTGYIEFGYNIGEIRLSKTLLQAVLSGNVAVFEENFQAVIIEAYVKAMDIEILTGVAANNQCEGILTEAAKANNGRVTAARIISFTAAEMADWTEWEKKFFGILPVELESGAEFVMAKKTYVGNLCTLEDSNGQPIKKAYFDVNDKQYVFNEVPVNRVETTLFKDFDSCANGEYFGMYWIPEKAYAINSNMQFGVTRYFDNEKNEYVDKALVINDGKILDPAYLYLLKKSA